MVRALLAAAVLAMPSAAHAYDLMTSSTGDALRWPPGEIVIEPALAGGPPEVSDGEAVGAVQVAVASWQAALDGAEVSIALAGAASGAIATGDGVNSVRWAMDEQDDGVDAGLLAKTHLAYRVDDGTILEADMVVNAAEFAWSTTLTGEACGDLYDLEGSISHEIGHLIGLGHSLDPEATMFATGRPCEVLKRDLLGDDAAAVDFLYRQLPPPGGVAPSPTTCAAAGADSPASAGWMVLVALAAPVGLGRRRRGAALLVAALGLGLPGVAPAAQLRLLDLGDLGARADLVVRGVVLEVEPAPDGELATDSVVAVTECLAGECPERVRVRRRGGERAGRGLWVEGEAELSRGQEVLLYLRARPGRPYAVLGGLQGALPLVGRGDTVFAARDLRGHRVLDGGGWRAGGVEWIDLDSIRGSLAAFR